MRGIGALAKRLDCSRRHPASIFYDEIEPPARDAIRSRTAECSRCASRSAQTCDGEKRPTAPEEAISSCIAAAPGKGGALRERAPKATSTHATDGLVRDRCRELDILAADIGEEGVRAMTLRSRIKATLCVDAGLRRAAGRRDEGQAPSACSKRRAPAVSTSMLREVVEASRIHRSRPRCQRRRLLAHRSPRLIDDHAWEMIATKTIARWWGRSARTAASRSKSQSRTDAA